MMALITLGCGGFCLAQVMGPASNGNYAGAVFLQHAHRFTFTRVEACRYNGDGFSFQVCDDVQFYDCVAQDCFGLGFHPGSGSQRPRFFDCRSTGNAQGIFFCWGVTDGLAERCTCSGNDVNTCYEYQHFLVCFQKFQT